MTNDTETTSGHAMTGRTDHDVELPVLASPRREGIRPSRTSRWRAGALIAVHLLVVAHVVHWLYAGRTLSPIEPSEAMYTLNDGTVNAGFIFFALAIVATAIFGRFVCGWGCHMIAYQDFSAWLLKRIGIKPKPLRSRLLVLAPLGLAVYMFVWPSAYRWIVAAPRPAMSNHLMTSDFWITFPGLVVAVLTVALCGFGIVYVLGAKGFCTYACPYGGFFSLAEQVAPGRIIVTDACEHCGHCTATCTSNVRVHEEVALYGMVVDPGCMKCMDCVSVCPNDALYFGFKKPSLGAKPASPRRAVPYDFALWEEALMIVVGLAALVSFRGLYNQIPLLLAMGLASMTAFLVMKLVRLVRDPHVRFQQLQLKRGGRLTRSGAGFALGMTAWLAFTAHSGAVQFESWRGRSIIASLELGDDVWRSDQTWWATADAPNRDRLDRAIGHLERADAWGLLPTPLVLNVLVRAYLARGIPEQAEQTLHRRIETSPDDPEPHRGLAWVMRMGGRIDEAANEYATALELEPDNDRSRGELAAMLIEAGRLDDAAAVYRAGMEVSPDDTRWSLRFGELLIRQGRAEQAIESLESAIATSPESPALRITLGMALMQARRFDEGLASLKQAIELDPDSGEAHYNLGYALLTLNHTIDALPHLNQAVEIDPHNALWQYNLGVVTFMNGAPNDALPHIRQATSLDPTDPQAWGFLAVVLEATGDARGANEARAHAEALDRQ